MPTAEEVAALTVPQQPTFGCFFVPQCPHCGESLTKKSGEFYTCPNEHCGDWSEWYLLGWEPKLDRIRRRWATKHR